MNRTALWTAILVLAFTALLPSRADFRAGQRAWDAGLPDEALAQWQAAADRNDPRAMLALGRLYRQGLGVIQDYVQAYKWLTLAASRSVAAAVQERDALAERITPEERTAAQNLAKAWRPGTVEAGQTSPAATPARIGSSHAPPPRAIREAQELLARLGYSPGPADGIWGRRTGEAYRMYLGDAGLPAANTLTPDALRAMRALAKRTGADLTAGRTTVAAGKSARVPSGTGTLRSTPAPRDVLPRAAQTGDIDGLKAALDAGADMDARDGRGWTALMHAANNGYTLLVELLLDARADPDMRAADGATALFAAALQGHAEIVAQLLRAGADESIQGPRGRTPLEVAQAQGYSKILELPEVVALQEARAREENAWRAREDSEAYSRAKVAGYRAGVRGLPVAVVSARQLLQGIWDSDR